MERLLTSYNTFVFFLFSESESDGKQKKKRKEKKKVVHSYINSFVALAHHVNVIFLSSRYLYLYIYSNSRFSHVYTRNFRLIRLWVGIITFQALTSNFLLFLTGNRFHSVRPRPFLPFSFLLFMLLGRIPTTRKK